MLVYCCEDLIFATKIRSTAEAVGAAARPARDVQALQNRLTCVDDGKLNEPVTGVVIDLAMGQTALELLKAVKDHDAQVPVTAFGSHVDVEILQAAHAQGADFVMPRSQFHATLPTILERLSGRDH